MRLDEDCDGHGRAHLALRGTGHAIRASVRPCAAYLFSPGWWDRVPCGGRRAEARRFDRLLPDGSGIISMRCADGEARRPEVADAHLWRRHGPGAAREGGRERPPGGTPQLALIGAPAATILHAAKRPGVAEVSLHSRSGGTAAVCSMDLHRTCHPTQQAGVRTRLRSETRRAGCLTLGGGARHHGATKGAVLRRGVQPAPYGVPYAVAREGHGIIDYRIR